MDKLDLEVGQVLWLIIRFNNNGNVSNRQHLYLIMDINEEFNYIEIAQLDSVEGKEFKAMYKSNHLILNQKPQESVIDRNVFLQMDNTFRVELCPEIMRFRKLKGKLSEAKRIKAIEEYFSYREKNIISENKNVYMSREELLFLNRPTY